MLHSLNDLENFAINATDGDIGHTKDFYFDDKQWAVRYLVVETGSWLASRKVLLSPIAIKEIDQEGKTMTVSI
ncbi:PRC-barrel domain-containing protein [Motilimonas cestriensis]|uniref:PRC-barrel domain-containing protein n=1 Tax=Motilimonas cestriensis TaxID=2742685 RepID=A0ABS8WBX5_9GAMM|nr:PRC-barrel domain-containing protein [Motilimonas cestriensis]MCE2594890.1 PRC-barrel domain-containing protein [Motilimonas cestriensis]